MALEPRMPLVLQLLLDQILYTMLLLLVLPMLIFQQVHQLPDQQLNQGVEYLYPYFIKLLSRLLNIRIGTRLLLLTYFLTSKKGQVFQNARVNCLLYL